MKTNILRILTAVAATAAAVSAFDLSGITTVIPEQYRWITLSVAGVAIAAKEIAVVVGDILDNGKRDGSFQA